MAAGTDIIARGMAGKAIGDLATKADLVNGKVPASQLPSYVDDVVEVENYAALPNPGEAGKIYITIDTNNTYRWGGSTYVQLGTEYAAGSGVSIVNNVISTKINTTSNTITVDNDGMKVNPNLQVTTISVAESISDGTNSITVAGIVGKQNALSQAQLNAVNSGITSSKVDAYDSYATSKQDTLTASSSVTVGTLTGTSLSDGTTTKAISSIINSASVFVATYTSPTQATAFADINQALEDGKDVVLYMPTGSSYSGAIFLNLVHRNPAKTFLAFGGTESETVHYVTIDNNNTWNKGAWKLQKELKSSGSGQNIKTINSSSILGSGDLVLNTVPALPADASTKTYTLQAVNGVMTWVETTWSN